MIAIQANTAASGTAPLAAPEQTGASGVFAGLLGQAATQPAPAADSGQLYAGAQPEALPAETTLVLTTPQGNAESLSPDAAAQLQGEGLPPVLLALRRLQPDSAGSVTLPETATTTTTTATTTGVPVSGGAMLSAGAASSTPASLPAAATLRHLLIRDESAAPAATSDHEPAATLSAKLPGAAAAAATRATSTAAVAVTTATATATATDTDTKTETKTETAAATIAKTADNSPDTASLATTPAGREADAARPPLPLPEAKPPPPARAAEAEVGTPTQTEDSSNDASLPQLTAGSAAPASTANSLRRSAAPASAPDALNTQSTSDTKAARPAHAGLRKPAALSDAVATADAATTADARPVSADAAQGKTASETSTADDETPDAGSTVNPAASAALANDNPLAAAAVAVVVTQKAAPAPDRAATPDEADADRILLSGRAAGKPVAKDSDEAAPASLAAVPAPGAGLSATPGKAQADDTVPAATLAPNSEPVHPAHNGSDNMNVPVTASADSGAASPSLATLLSSQHNVASAPTSGSDAPASGGGLSTPVPVDADLPEALGERVLMLSEAGVSSARIELHPAELGSLVVRIEVHNDQAQVAFSADNPVTRSLLQQAMPQLRELFGGQGLQLMRTRVEERQRDSGGSSSSGFATGRARSETAAVRRIGRIRLVDAYV